MLGKQSVLIDAFLALNPAGHIQRILLDQFLFHQVRTAAIVEPLPCIRINLRGVVLIAVLCNLGQIFGDGRHVFTHKSAVLCTELDFGQRCLAGVPIHQLLR